MEYTEFEGGKFQSHMSFEDGGSRVDSFKIIAPSHILNGTKVYKIVWTPKTGFMNWGTPEVFFQHDNKPKKEYKTINGLLKSLGLPKLRIDNPQSN